MRAETQAPLPFHVLTGFLGSGKTTLLNRLLATPIFASAVVLINEYGEIAIDHMLVREAREELLLLSSGCVCCTLRKDLVEQLLSLLDQRARGEIPRFSRVVLETTGLADPAPIIQTLVKHPVLSEALYLDGVVCTVDAQLGLTTLASQGEARKQVSIADRMLLTKLDLADPEQLPALEQALRALNPLAPIVGLKVGGDISRVLLEAGHLDTRGVLYYAPAEPGHLDAVDQISVTLHEPLDFASFSLWLAMLTQLWAERVLRVKGVITARGEPGPIAIQAVQHVVYPPLDLPPIPGLDGKSQIVILTRGLTGAERAEIASSLRALVSSGASA